MTQAEFQYNGVSTIIQCQENQKMSEICNNFISKSHLNENEINYFYDGKGGSKFNKNLTFKQMANAIDKKKKKMNILVMINEMPEEKKLVRAKNIICPECGESIKVKIKNYKINLFECKNKHKMNKILFNEFEKTQMIDLMDIKCDLCKENNKANAYNNEFYKCYECNINICPLCKLKHDKLNHTIINYDKIHYICNKHDELLTNYCKKCNLNICSLCEKDHLEHDKILLSSMIYDKKDLLNKLDNIKKSMNIFNENINKIIEILNIVRINMENYYKLSEYIINNYNQKEKKYEILYNINEIINNNDIINDINIINNENDIKNKFNNIFNIYNKIYINEIKLTVKVEKDDVNKEIYFLDNTDEKITIEGEFKGINKYGAPEFNEIKEEHHHDLLKELNESNVELYINNKKYKYEKYFIPDKEGLYNILLKFHILINDCSFMFYNCFNLTNINLSSFNTQNVTNMSCMFAFCSNLTNINLSSFNTQNVTNMSYMFQGCSNLTNIDLSLFNTQNVTNMSNMFYGCSNLKEIKINKNLCEKIKNEINEEKIKIIYIE